MSEVVKKDGTIQITFKRTSEDTADVAYNIDSVAPREIAFAISMLFGELSRPEQIGMIAILDQELETSGKAPTVIN